MAPKKSAKPLGKKDMKKTKGGSKKTTSGGTQQEYLKIELKDVQITGY